MIGVFITVLLLGGSYYYFFQFTKTELFSESSPAGGYKEIHFNTDKWEKFTLKVVDR
ncbi:hypothetical protein [Bacillus massilioanorexius]|uniref:hypothetical protein n=1 Tax=Bacillus massilioanorexius TaxID=1468413 RepID=UPI0002D96FAD|nr:hypothetical protein [Bacillus massilioanorexius]